MRTGDSRATRASSSDIAGCHPRPVWDSAQRAATARSADDLRAQLAHRLAQPTHARGEASQRESMHCAESEA